MQAPAASACCTLRRFRARRSALGGWEASQHWNEMPFAVLLSSRRGQSGLGFTSTLFLFRPRQGGSRPHISEGSEFSELYAAWRHAASRAAPNLKRADSILRSKMPFTWVGPPRPDPSNRHPNPSISRQRELQPTPNPPAGCVPRVPRHRACVRSRHGAARPTPKAAARPMPTPWSENGMHLGKHACDRPRESHIRWG